ncbi:MAG: hypothetical protein LBB43_06950 [Spirochaetaceae bacterium]|jgi:trk system potassium uptake protein TrkH|nr:hypothetical protein [Spirochaetaceae bacterium]
MKIDKALKVLLRKSDTFLLLAFFSLLIGVGSLLLMLPWSWAGSAPLRWIDALFTAASAACVTGLSTVAITNFTKTGQIIIIMLMQIGAFGIISFGSLLVSIPRAQGALNRLNTIKGFYLDGVEYRPRKIVWSIMLFTFSIEGTGILFLSLLFVQAGVEDWLFNAFFHAVSCFCHVGFSNLPNALMPFAYNPAVLTVIMLLTIGGGIGFVVLHEVLLVLRKKRKRLSYHSKIVLIMTAVLTGGAALFFLIAEAKQAYKGMDPFHAFLCALFQSVNTRSSGLEIVPQALLTQASKLLSSLRMFIGGAPGSFAGGIRVTPLFVICVVMVKEPDIYGDIKIFHHRLSAETLNKGVVYVLKSIALFVLIVAALMISDGTRGFSATALFYESISAFGNVGLSMGITADLSNAGKWILIAAMFMGRVALFVLAFPALKRGSHSITYPQVSLLME